MGRVVIGMDPHGRSATIEIIDKRERLLGQGRFGTGTDGYRQMLAAGQEFRIGCGRWTAALGSIGTSPSAWSLTARRLWRYDYAWELQDKDLSASGPDACSHRVLLSTSGSAVSPEAPPDP
jgi:hypothetical protein